MQGHRLGTQGPSRSPPKPVAVLVGKGPLLRSSPSADRPANHAAALPYTIFKSSPCSPGYGAENLLIEKPSDLSSRWSASSPAQVVSGEEKATEEGPYVILELKHLSVLRGVVFGKAEKAHPCNAQWVKIYAGLTPYSMNEVFVGNLRNDGLSELKGVRSSAWVWTGNMDRKSGVKSKPRDELVFPVKFVKICPGPAYEPRFNTSLWYVEPFGNSDPKYVNRVHKAWNQTQDLQANRVILKHLRAQKLDTPFDSLMQSLSTMPDRPEHILEHPILSRLFDALVKAGDFQAGEAIIDELVTNDMMSQEAWRSQTCKLRTLGVPSSSMTPESRDGPGTAMRDDSIYMFGGHRDKLLLDDFWVGRIQNSIISWDKLQRTEPDDPWPPAMACQYMIALDTHVAMIDVYPATAWTHTGDGNALRPEPGSTMTAISGKDHGLIAPEMLDTLMALDDPSHEHDQALASSNLWLYNLESRKWTEHAPPQSVSTSGESVELCVHGLDVCPGGLEIEFHTGTKFHQTFMDPRTGEWKSLHESDWKGQKLHDAEDPASETFDRKHKEKYGVEPYSERDGVQITWDPVSYEMLVLRRNSEGLLEIDPFDWYNRDFRRETVTTTQVFPSSGYWAEILTSETERDGIWIQQGEEQIVCERVDFGRVQAFTRTCVQAIRKHRFSEMVDNSDTMGALEYLKGPLQDVLQGDAYDIQLLASYILKGSPMNSDAERWHSRLKLFDLIVALVDDRFTEPVDSLTNLLPV